jgi:hypothetical protein
MSALRMNGLRQGGSERLTSGGGCSVVVVVKMMLKMGQVKGRS